MSLTLFRRSLRICAALLIGVLAVCSGRANPSGGSVAQGSATFSSSGSKLTIQTSQQAFINWQSFNIGVGETTTFVQPSSSSLVWNQIHDANPSQILGNLNANGYVVLQNQSGFYIGGQASISTHGLIITTAPIPMPDLSSGGAWQFDSPPPTASIINYGQINVAGGSPAFLIANNIQNNGSITAPGGKIGLYAGKEVLVSERPDGRGLSAVVTLPAGSVDNSGKLIADAGTIEMNAQVVNQGGLVQANSLREVNGVIELVASDTLNIGASSVISAKGDPQGTSSGGSVTLKSGNQYADNAGSVIDVSGGAQGGNGGQLEISAPSLSGGIQSQLLGSASPGWNRGSLTLDPNYVDLVNGTGSSGSGSTASDPLLEGVSSFPSFGQISVIATQNIEIGSTINNVTSSTQWSLSTAATPSSVSLTAGNSIIVDDGSYISAGKNWSLTLSAGPQNLTSKPAAGTDGIYLNGGAYLQALNGNISLWAANEVLINDGSTGVDVGRNGITTTGGGNISVTAEFGDVNSGGNPKGYDYDNGLNFLKQKIPYYVVDTSLGGISTAAGGNVTINAGEDVISYLPSGSTAVAAGDAGSGAFGPQPGNVTINAGRNVTGHYVLANGVGTITAGGDFGAGGNFGNPADGDNPFALSLVKGTWNINAPNGSIYLQEVRNPNGVFDNVNNSLGHFLFDYDPQSAVNLTAGDAVYLTGQNVPRPYQPIPIIYPPTLDITAGSGGVVLDSSVILFPSAYQNLNITTTGGGNFSSPVPAGPIGAPPELLMSDSAQTRWLSAGTFGDSDHGSTPFELNNPNPVIINISGSMEYLSLITTKETQINVGGDMINCSFSGENLHRGDTTSIKVGGQIFNASPYTFVFLNPGIPNIPAVNLPPNIGSSWDEIFNLLVNATAVQNIVVPANTPLNQLLTLIPANDYLFPTANSALILNNPGFVYNTATGRLGFAGAMPPDVKTALTQPLTVLRYGANGLPVTYVGNDGKTHFVTDTINWAPPAEVQTLYDNSQNDPSPASPQIGYRLGGPGNFNVSAGSISLGNSFGILSLGVSDPQSGLNRYANLAPYTTSGATVNVTVTGNLDMLTSTIAAIGGGNVNVISTDGSMDLGSQELFNTHREVGFGVFTSGGGDVSVVAQGDVNIDGSRIATYNGGNIFVESKDGNVNAGSGGTTFNGVEVSYVDPITKKAASYDELVFGSGIVANTLVNPSAVPGSAIQPGNITVTTPRGNIEASAGGIVQEALNGNVSGGPTIKLSAGTAATAGVPGSGFVGNIDLGDSGVIGGTVDARASGNINGLVISRQSSTVVAAQSFTGTVLSGGTANVSAVAGSVSGTVIGVGGASVTGGQGVTASVLGQNVSVNGGASQSTLGTTAAASSASQSAAGTANTDAKDQTLGSETAQNDDDLKKKKLPLLTKLVSRVTVILPK